MSLDLVSKKLGWPSRERILRPSGAGPRVLGRLATQKIQEPLRRLQDCHVGLLTANPEASTTDAPLAVVCEFPRQAPLEALRLAHKLAWNFCHSPLLITVEPHLLRAWSCCKSPSKDPRGLPADAEVTEAAWNLGETVSAQVTRVLDWVQLLSGETFRSFGQHFQRKGSADQLLLSNLSFVRERLLNLPGSKLDQDTCHDLLARVIFTQFLCQRQDASGKSALSPQKLSELLRSCDPQSQHGDLNSVLRSKANTYKLFRWLNDRFNGDLFPGKGPRKQDRDAAWHEEMEKVSDRHLRLLADFVDGQNEMAKGQRWLWREYSFDAIPLEFVSSLYEQFVTKQKKTDRSEVVASPGNSVHYTPGHLVDFILDGVLPWNGNDWNLKVLDPACGSGIFLVKAFQRLIERWKVAHPSESMSAADLRRLLEENIRGVDIDRDAVRVASFSLYLAMCDEIDPKQYWTQVKFPSMRNERLLCADFFREDVEGILTEGNARSYDLVVGNAPWGKASTEGSEAVAWAKAHGWKVANKNIGPLFLAKASALAKPTGRIAMLQPAGALLFNRESTVIELRQKLFSTYKVEEVVNLSALRFGLFSKAVSPACIVTMRPVPPDGEPTSYVCPKTGDDFSVTIEPQDVSWVSPSDTMHNPLVWTALTWGGRRDLAFSTQLARMPSLARLENVLSKSEGIIRGRGQETWPESVGRPILENDDFPDGTFLQFESKHLPSNTNPKMRRAMHRNRPAFDPPQMLVAQSWRTADMRFRAAIVCPDESRGGALCTQSFVSIHAMQGKEAVLQAACLSLNSIVAVYYLLLTSGRFASYRPEVLVEDILSVPIPDPRSGLLDGLRTFDDVDARVKEAFGFKDAEWVLIEDLFNYTLADFKGGLESPGRQPTRRNGSTGNDKHLKSYCEYFLRVLKAGFGQEKKVSATIFQETQPPFLPLRLVAIHLDAPSRQGVATERLETPGLRERLLELHARFMKSQANASGGVSYTRVARLYDTVRIDGRNVPTIYIIKPDQIRYWTRSMAMRDADEVAADIMLWTNGGDKRAPSTKEGSRA